MMLRTLVTAVAVLCCCQSAFADSPRGLSLLRIAPGQTIKVQTEARIYHFRMVKPLTGETSAQVSTDGGKTFSSPQRIFIFGATAGRPQGEILFTRSHIIQPGLKMELGLGSRRRRDRAVSLTVRVAEER